MMNKVVYLLFKFWTICVFESPCGGAYTYDVHLRLIGKRVVDFPLVTIELFCQVLTGEALQAKAEFCNGVGQYPPNFSIERDVPHQSFIYG